MSEKNPGMSNYIENKYKNKDKKKVIKVVVENPASDAAEPIKTVTESVPAEQNNPEVVVSSPETAPATGENQAEIPMTEEDIKGRLIELDGLFNRLTSELQAGDESSKKGFFKKFFTFFKKEQLRDESDVEKISRKEGQELIQIKNKIENHKSKYENNLGLVKDILSEEDKVIIEQNKVLEDNILSVEQENCQNALDDRKLVLFEKYNSRKTIIEECLIGYNEINNQTSKTRMETAIQVLQAERAVRNLSNDKQATETLEVLRITIVEKLSKLKEQQLEIDHRYKLVRQRIVKLQTDYFEAKNMLNKINNLGKTTHEIAKEIRDNREEAEKFRKEKEAEKKEEEKKEAERKAAEAAAAAAKENQDKQAKEDDKNEDETKDDQVTTGNKQESQDNQKKQPENQGNQKKEIDIKALDEFLLKKKKFNKWNWFIKGSKNDLKNQQFYGDFYSFVEKRIQGKKFKIEDYEPGGIDVRQLMVDYIMEKKPGINKEKAERMANFRLDKIRQRDS